MSGLSRSLTLISVINVAVVTGCSLFVQPPASSVEVSGPQVTTPSAGAEVSTSGASGSASAGSVNNGSAEATSTGASGAAPAAMPERYVGLTMRQREYAQSQDDYFQRAIESYAARCGQPINAEIEWRSFASQIERHFAGGFSFSFYGYCAGFIEHVESICRNGPALSRQAVLGRVREFRCRYNDGQARSFQLAGNRVTVGINWEASNYTEWYNEQIGNAL